MFICSYRRYIIDSQKFTTTEAETNVYAVMVIQI